MHARRTLLRLVHVCAALILTLSLASCEFSCSTGGIDTAKAEKLISDNMEKQHGVKPKSVDCPDKVEEKKGESFTCKVTLDDGTTFDAVVEMKGEGNVSAKWEMPVGGGAPAPEEGGEPMPEEGGEPMPEEGGEPMPEEGGEPTE